MLDKDYLSFPSMNFKDDTGFLILQVTNLWKNYYGYILKKHHGLLYMQYIVLASIYRFNLQGREQVTQTLLAKHIKIDPMTLSYIFKGLETKGYIYREPHATDIRAKAIILTQAGKELMDQAVHTIMEADRKFFQVLEKNTNYFNKYLIKLLNAND